MCTYLVLRKTIWQLPEVKNYQIFKAFPNRSVWTLSRRRSWTQSKKTDNYGPLNGEGSKNFKFRPDLWSKNKKVVCSTTDAICSPTSRNFWLKYYPIRFCQKRMSFLPSKCGYRGENLWQQFIVSATIRPCFH